MANPCKPSDPPRRSSFLSSDRKRPRHDKECLSGESKKRKVTEDGVSDRHASPSSPVAEPSHCSDVNTASVVPTPQDDQLGRLTVLLSGVIEKLGRSAELSTPRRSLSGFSDIHALSFSEEDAGEVVSVPDPLDELEQLCATPPDPREDAEDDDAGFLRALDELSGHFHGEEGKGPPLSDRLATILDASMRRRPSSEGVKLICNKIKLPSNVPNLLVPATNSAIAKAMSVGGRLLDTRLFHTNSLLTKALVPIAQCVSDIGEKKGQSVNCYLDGLNNSVRLLASAVNYVNHLRKEIVRLHVHDSALAELCK